MLDNSRVIVRADLLAAITPIVDAAHPNSGLRGVNITAHPAGGVVMAAFNGSVLALLRDDSASISGAAQTWKPLWKITKAKDAETQYVAMEARPAGRGEIRIMAAHSAAHVLANYSWKVSSDTTGEELICARVFTRWESLLTEKLGDHSLPVWVRHEQIEQARVFLSKVLKVTMPHVSLLMSFRTIGRDGCLITARSLDEAVVVLTRQGQSNASMDDSLPDWLLEVRDTRQRVA